MFNDLDDINSIITKLNKSPLFYLFLSSKELFHTNFWDWLSTLNQIETIKLFTNQKINERNFLREYNQKNGDVKSKIDLLILAGSEIPKIVIENKVKDFPQSEQLERIKESFGKENPQPMFILVTLFWFKGLKDLGKGWNIVTYANLAERINCENFSNDIYYQSIISDYKTFTANLASLASKLPVTESYDFAVSQNKDGLYKILNDIKFWESYQKMRASHMLLCFNKKLNKIGEVKTVYSINNQKATITFEISLIDEYKIGIQIEDNQYRKFVSGKKAQKFIESLIGKKIFFEQELYPKDNSKYCNYGSIFKYKYDKLRDNKQKSSSIPFEELFKKIIKDTKYIKENLESIKEQIPK